jgi:hypothetical protein
MQAVEILVVDGNQTASWPPPAKLSAEVIVEGLLQEMLVSLCVADVVQRIG